MLDSSITVTILGGGSFGTAIANIVAENNHRALLWMRNEERAQEINLTRENATYLPGYTLNKSVEATTDLAGALKQSQVVFMSIPSQSTREIAQLASPHIAENTIVVSTTKGIESEGFHLMSQVLKQEIPQARIAVLSGPNLAKEVAARQLTGTVIASSDDSLNKVIQELLHSSYFRVYSSNDMFGVELGGALKNVYAIMSGFANALGLGQNTQAMLLTRSLAEMSRFAVNMGADPLTFLGLSGVGDLIVTCMSPLSRNYRVGYALGEGKTLKEIMQDFPQTAEGVNTIKTLKAEADKKNIYMPLVTGLHGILFEDKTIADVVEGLMTGEQNSDVDYQFQIDK